MLSTLAAARAARYGYTRPAAAALLTASGFAADFFSEPKTSAKQESAGSASKCSSASAEQRPLSSPSAWVERFTALPALAIGIAGVFTVAHGRGGLSWLSHGYERVAWSLAYGSLAAAAATVVIDGGRDGFEAERALLAPGAGAALAAVAGERLGSVVGRALLPTLTGFGALGAALALHGGDDRGQRAVHVLQMSCLVMLPSLHLACLPVYTLSSESLLALAWFGLGAGIATTLEGPAVEPLPSVESVRRLLLAVGSASLLRTLHARAPICHF
jgi:hypothetical protein